MQANPFLQSWLNPTRYDVRYAQRDGLWEARCDALGAQVSASTLEHAREEIKIAAKTALAQSTGLPDPADAAERVYAEQLLVRRFFNHSLVGLTAGWDTGHGPYTDDDDQLLLRESVVIVLDELGTTERWMESFTLNDLHTRAALLTDVKSWLSSPVSAGVESAVSYTDNVIHATPVGKSVAETMGYALVGPARYQLALTVNGTLLRGGIAAGLHHASPGLLAGPALVCAHQLEAKCAKFPRVILSAPLAEAVTRAVSLRSPEVDVDAMTGLLLRDEDDSLFLNYLGLPVQFDEVTGNAAAELAAHRDAVAAGLVEYGDHPEFGPKWLWAADYHNHIADNFGGRDLRVERRGQVAAEIPVRAFTPLSG